MAADPKVINLHGRDSVEETQHLRRNKDDKIIRDEENVLRILCSDPRLRGKLNFNEFSREITLSGPLPGSEVSANDTYPRRWKDADSIALQSYLQALCMPTLGLSTVNNAVLLHASRHSYHPLRDYLNSVTWDGRHRVPTLAKSYLDSTKQPGHYLQAVISAFLVSAVARVYQPGCQVDSALVLEGPQGVGKSSALRILASDQWFSDSLPHDLAHKDAKDHLKGHWIIELPEVTQFKKSEIETVKAFLSRRHENYRPAYGRHEISYPRQCVFAGTTNETEYLVDTTGNRRFWPVTCGEIDLQSLADDRDQIWAEAVHLYTNKAVWHLTGEASEAAFKEAKERITVDPWTGPVLEILEHLKLSAPAERDIVAPGEILRKLDIATEQRHAKSAVRVGTILSELGWLRGKRDRTRGQLFHRPPEEQKREGEAP